MEPSSILKVVEVCQVAPPPSSAEFTLPLSFYDLSWLRFPPTKRLFFYESSSYNSSFDTFYETTLPRLKESLSTTLEHYLPLAGNLVWDPNSDKPVLHFAPGDSLSLVVAESQADFHYLSSDGFRRSEELHTLLPELPPTETKVPVLTLQVTLFPNEGVSIGYTGHHAVLDGKTLAMFMHSWAFICRSGGDNLILAPESVPNYDRTVVKDPVQEKLKLDGWLERNGPGNKSLVYWNLKPSYDTMLATFRLSYKTIEDLKRSVLGFWEEEDKPRLSTFTAVSAWTWACLVKSQKLEAQTITLVFSADGRTRKSLDPLVPSNYFGNCLLGCRAETNSEELMKNDGVAVATKLIVDCLKILDVEASRKDESSETKLTSLPKGKIYSIGGSPRFELYKVDFGWGRPKKVELISIDLSGAFSHCDPRDATCAIEIGVAIKEHEIGDFTSLFGNGLGIH